MHEPAASAVAGLQIAPWGIAAIVGLGAALALALVMILRARSAKRPASPAPTPAAKPDPAPAPTAKPAAAKPAAAKPNGEYAVILAGETHGVQLAEALGIASVRVTSAQELRATVKRRKPQVAFIDVELLPSLSDLLPQLRVVGIVNRTPSETLARMVRTLDGFASVSQLITVALLSSPFAKTHLKMFLESLALGPKHDMLGDNLVGRVAMIAQASHRETRFGRMQEYFAKQGMSTRTITAINDVAEELVMNALYNAPTEAGFFKVPVSRTEDVSLPLEHACEITYGVEDGNAFVRLRDTFGALRRDRLVEVLNRCSNAAGVKLDESRGGAGLGVWRVFLAATTIAITVIPGRLTDITVRLAPKQGRSVKQLLAVHLFFLPEPVETPQFDHDSSLVDHSITLMHAPV